MSRFVLREDVRERDVAEIIRNAQPSVRMLVEGIQPKAGGSGVLAGMRKRKSELVQEAGGVDAGGVLSALMDERNDSLEAVKIRRLFKGLRKQKADWWSLRVLDQRLVDRIVTEELEIGILEAVKSGVDVERYVRKDATVGNVTVRKAGREDVPDIMRLLTLGVREEHGVAELPAFKIDTIGIEYSFYYLGFVDGKLAGIRALDPRHDVAWRSPDGRPNVKTNVAYLKDGFVLPEYRRHGVSKAIDERIFEEAGRKGIAEIYDATESDFMLQSRLKKGFTVCGACLTCRKGPGCGGKLVKKDLKM